jgi:hypothetical protein
VVECALNAGTPASNSGAPALLHGCAICGAHGAGSGRPRPPLACGWSGAQQLPKVGMFSYGTKSRTVTPRLLAPRSSPLTLPN